MKNNYKKEPYLIDVKNFEDRRSLTKLRVSDHILEIERGRFKNVKREDRIRKFCNLKELDDEKHFFFSCTLNTSLRKDFFDHIKDLYEAEKDNQNFNTEFLVKCLSSPEILRFSAPFIRKSLKLRRVD